VITIGIDPRLHAWATALAEEGELHSALEDARNVSGRLERFLPARSEIVLRVGTRLMAGTRKTARTYGKSDSIDALAIARAALREPDLPRATHEPKLRELKLLVDHREDLVAERTAVIFRLGWHLHELDPGLEPFSRTLNREPIRRGLAQRLGRYEQGVQVRICRDLLTRVGEITREKLALRAEIAEGMRPMAPRLPALSGVGDLIAARLLAEAGVAGRFATDAKLARHAGCALIEVASGRMRRRRLSRMGNRKLNTALHQGGVGAGSRAPEARAYLDKKRAEGKTTKEAFRCLKRHLVRAVWMAMQEPNGVAISPPMF
jgi:transposase